MTHPLIPDYGPMGAGVYDDLERIAADKVDAIQDSFLAVVWDEAGWGNGGWQVCTADAEVLKPHVSDWPWGLPVFVCQRHERTYIHPDTWDLLRNCNEFLDDFTGGDPGMKYIVTESGSYGRAARAKLEAEAKANPPAPVDQLAQLLADANALVLQAAGLNTTPSVLQLRVFGERLAELQTRHAVLVDELDRAKSLIDLAGTAVFDAAS